MSTYTVLTPFGVATATFPEDEGVEWAGSETAIRFLRDSIATRINGEGYSLTADMLEPDDLFYFCQPEGSGIVILKPEEDLIADAIGMQDDGGTLDAATPDDDGIDALRKSLAETRGVLARLGIAAQIVESLLNDVDDSEDAKITRGQRQRDNNSAVELLERIEREGLEVGPAERAILAKYSGSGGGLTRYNGRRGSPYEYYTPKPVAAGVWNLLNELGFAGGRVLDPSAGTGIFGQTAPENTVMDAVELDDVSGRINAVVNKRDGYAVRVAPFEEVAGESEDEQYDAVVTNVPFGDAGLRVHANKDSKYRRYDLGSYFVLRSLDKLRPGGLAAFITPTGLIDAIKHEKFRQAASLKAEFLGAYRLPNKVFDTAGADVITDVMVWRKFSRDAAERIAECREQSPDTLTEAGVLWPEFIRGKYFRESGRRFVLGEVVEKPGRFYVDGKLKMVEAVVNEQSIANISKLLTRFPDSRINWSLLDAAETVPLTYEEGDTMVQDGVTLKFTDGRWIALQSNPEVDTDMSSVQAALSDPLVTLNERTTWANASRFIRYNAAQNTFHRNVPEWVRPLFYEVEAQPEGTHEAVWFALITGCAVRDVREANAGVDAFNFYSTYPDITNAAPAASATARKTTAKNKTCREALSELETLYTRKGGFADWWNGAAGEEATIPTETAASKYERLAYGATGGDLQFVPIETMRAAQIDFDPMADDEWCIDAAGTGVMRADDYYFGKYTDFLARIEADIKAAANDDVRAKLLRQRIYAESRLLKVDPKRVRFALTSPFVTLEQKLAFAQQYLSPAFALDYDGPDGKPRIKADLGSSDMPDRRSQRYVDAKALELFWSYFEKGKFDMRMPKDIDPDVRSRIVLKLRELAETGNVQFNVWCKSHPGIQATISALADDPAKLRFRPTTNQAYLDIPGLKKGIDPDTGKPHPYPHSYQFQTIRRFSREFSGILGDDVGLGKTFQALWTVQHVQNIGVKKRTIFAVPKAVLANWYREASRTYESLDKCLFVGMTRAVDAKTGAVTNDRGDGAAVRRDLKRITSGKFNKIFMTIDDLSLIPLRKETIDGYVEYLRSIDESLKSQSSEEGEERVRKSLNSFLEGFDSQDRSITYFEDMGVDSLVLDEAHNYKNSRFSVDYKAPRFLATPLPSGRGVDAQAKAWVLRSNHGDGVMPLTATWITNSPLEIYSMLSLAMGEERIQEMMLGIKGADDFLKTFCDVRQDEETTITGDPRPDDVFDGINNLSMLQTVIAGSVLGRNAKQVGEQIVVPETSEDTTEIVLDRHVIERLIKYKGAYAAARDLPGGDGAALAEILRDEPGATQNLIGHPFNLINRMERLIMDPELDRQQSRFTVPRAQVAAAIEVVGKFNALKITEERSRHSPMSTDEDVVRRKVTLNDDGDEEEVLIVRIRGVFDDAARAIILDTLDQRTQQKFMALAQKAGLDLDVSIPPKLAALIANVQKENEHPRNFGGDGVPRSKAKQLIFCDALAMHNKIKIALHKRCGIPMNKIAFITAPAAPNPEDVQEISDGFNLDGDANQYQIVVGNKKAEVGINLQKGAQAIHHMTLGWTPDSEHQRNGRGIRQGNTVAVVNVYFYEAEGTFDKYRRMLVNRKGDWISTVLTDDNADQVKVGGSYSEKDLEALIDTTGDADASEKFRRELAEREAAETRRALRTRQIINLATIKKQGTALRQTFDAFYRQEAKATFEFAKSLAQLRKRLTNPKLAQSARTKIGLTVELNEASLVGKMERLREVGLNPVLMRTIEQLDTRTMDRYVPVPEASRINPASEMYQDWEAGRAQSQELVDASRKDFTDAAKLGGGALTPAFLEAVESGDADVVLGVPVRVGDLVRLSGTARGLARVGVRDRKLLCFSEALRYPQPVNDAIGAGAVVIEPGSAAYESALDEAAALDEALILSAGLHSESGETALSALFSTFIPPVAERMKSSLPVAMDIEVSVLPAPLFPKFISDSISGNLVSELASAQRAAGFVKVGDSWQRLFGGPAGGVRQVATRDALNELCAAYLWQLAKVKGYTFDAGTLSPLLGAWQTTWLVQALKDDPQFGGIVEAIKAASSKFESNDHIDSWLIEFTKTAVPSAPVTNGMYANTLRRKLNDGVPGLDAALVAIYQSLSDRAQEIAAKRLAEEAAARAAAEAERLARMTAEEAARAAALATSPFVGLAGSGTMAMKERFKEAAISVGSKAEFKSSPQPMWTVPRAAYEKLQAQYPNGMPGIQVVPPHPDSVKKMTR
ncbi:SNF2-related protein [Nevskia sp.]|uniref:SNF2-related protein n=1 Tax=Nevskia sp. TaxID=1929292 RepID=UPI0025D8B408|nr:SNF2-related protein [Nevskia sp.]